MLLRIQHETKLSYSSPVSETVFEVRMAPPSDEDQTALSYKLRLDPPAPVTSYRDGFGNRVDLFNVTTPYRDLVVQTTSHVRTHRRPVADRLDRSGTSWPDDRPSSIESMEFLQPSPLVPRCDELDEFVAGLSFRSGPVAELLRRVMEAVRDRLRYDTGVTKSRTHAGEALKLGGGVCQDFAHVTIGACRGLGLPARYVSGYVNHPGELATHAWCQVWAGEAVGWVDLDPTHAGFVDDNYVTTAVGRDYNDVPPNRGLWKGRAEETIGVGVTVVPVDRVPLEWNDWNPTPFRPMSPAGQSQFQRQSMGGPRGQRNSRSPYPNQRQSRGSHQQQGEQQ